MKAAASLVVWALSVTAASSSVHRTNGRTPPPPPAPEPIELTDLPHPPALPHDAAPGDCNLKVNPNGTGCMSATSPNFSSGGFLPDGKHILMLVDFVGAPEGQEPASVYTGQQMLAVKTDGGEFPSGGPWKCLTCGVEKPTEDLWYPQPFWDGKRALIGNSILQCDNGELISDKCTSDNIHIYPIRHNVSPDGEGEGGAIRELRVHPDNLHLGYSTFAEVNGQLEQYGYFGTLVFNPSPEKALPAGPRYDVEDVTVLIKPDRTHRFEVDGDELVVVPEPLHVGELRAFSGDGSEVTYVGASAESSNIDVFAADLKSGAVRRLTEHPEYIDPIQHSPDNKWLAIMDTRTTDRQMWLSGMRNIPPLTDMVTTHVVASTRNNGVRRFFRPFLLDFWGDRGDYFGQRINDEGSGVAGSGDFNDPEWNGRADPMWSPDSTQVVYWESQTVAPNCGGINPLPCYPPTEPGGRRHRAVLATFTSRARTKPATVVEAPESIPWGVPYVPGEDVPRRQLPPPGNYTLNGKASGHAAVSLGSNPSGKLNRVEVEYFNFSDNGIDTLVGTELTINRAINATASIIDWYSDLNQTGSVEGSKRTSPGGLHMLVDVLLNNFEANGTLTTTLDGVEYNQPLTGA